MNIFVRLLPLLTVAVLVAACASSAGSGWTYAPVESTPPPSAGASGAASPGGSPGASVSGSPSAGASQSPGGSPSGNTIELEETGDLRILQDGEPVTELQVKTGETYTFKVTNSAGFTHDFYIGTAEALEANQTSDLEGIPEFASGTKEFEWTAPAAGTQLQFACTVPGHYQPMHGDLVIQ
jgi:hypothetical protein